MHSERDAFRQQTEGFQRTVAAKAELQNRLAEVNDQLEHEKQKGKLLATIYGKALAMSSGTSPDLLEAPSLTAVYAILERIRAKAQSWHLRGLVPDAITFAMNLWG